MAKQKLRPEDVTLEDCKASDFGCRQCLWNSVECKDYGKFVPAVTYDAKNASCQSYAYCD